MENVQDYYCNNKPLSQTSRFKQQNKLFMEKKGRNIEELNDRWKTNPAFLEDTTGHLNNLNEGLQGKGKLITDDDDNFCILFIRTLSIVQFNKITTFQRLALSPSSGDRRERAKGR
jgi:hypothetical protein